jgi:hypothetical protein
VHVGNRYKIIFFVAIVVDDGWYLAGSVDFVKCDRMTAVVVWICHTA